VVGCMSITAMIELAESMPCVCPQDPPHPPSLWRHSEHPATFGAGRRIIIKPIIEMGIPESLRASLVIRNPLLLPANTRSSHRYSFEQLRCLLQRSCLVDCFLE